MANWCSYVSQKKKKRKGRKNQTQVPPTTPEVTYMALSQQESGRTLGTIPWELPSRMYEGLFVSTSPVPIQWSKPKYSRIMS